MVAVFEDDISDDDKIKLVTALSKALNAAESSGIKFAEFRIEMGSGALTAVQGEVWICKDGGGDKMICSKLK
jgi:hypothetical protein